MTLRSIASPSLAKKGEKKEKGKPKKRKIRNGTKCIFDLFFKINLFWKITFLKNAIKKKLLNIVIFIKYNF